MKELILKVHFSFPKLISIYLLYNFALYFMLRPLVLGWDHLIKLNKPLDPVFVSLFISYFIPACFYQLYLISMMVEVHENIVIVRRFIFLIKVYDLKMVLQILEFNDGTPNQIVPQTKVRDANNPDRIFNGLLFKNGDTLIFPGYKKDWTNLDKFLNLAKEYTSENL